MHRGIGYAGSIIVVFAICCLTVLTGCGKQPVAVVNGTKVTRAEFTERLESTQGKQVLGDLILRALVEDAFQKSGLTLDDAAVQKEIDTAKASAPDEKAWQQILEARGMTEDDFREFLAFQMKVEKLATKDVTASDENMKKFFEENKARFFQPESLEFSEIVLGDKVTAQKLAKELSLKPDGFANLAKAHSLSAQTRERGGRRDKVPTEQISPVAVRMALADMKEGQISDPVEAEGNWYLLKMEKRYAAKQPAFEEVKDDVQRAYMLANAKSQQELLDELLKSAQVTIVDEKYSALNEFFQKKPDNLPKFGGAEQAPSTDKPAAEGTPAASPDTAQ